MKHIIPDTSRTYVDINSEMLWNAIQTLDAEEKAQVWQYIKTLQAQKQPLAVDVTPYMPLPASKVRLNHTLEELKAIADAQPIDFEWNYEKLRKAFPTEPRIKVELIDGQLCIYPNELANEPEIVGNIGFLMLQASDNKRKGDLLFAPMDLVLDERNIFQPTICFLSPSQRHKIEGNTIYGVPEVVVEIVSSTEAVQERELKRDIYESFGVREYWEVRPDKKRIEVEVLQQGEFIPSCKARRKGKVYSTVFHNFSLAVEDIFDRD
jgi:Uma2 family endonuclease